ncbi:hypothetical protein [Stenotrophomonas sp. Iso1]|uniref:hypothetical protein n=1 Tax=Stenotrophomonas sp. Iso1 TaxID=2977283 RepID=UPI0022B7942A|nr:hypothetical protein [Stenotrophomonas sp. Iso1]
MNLLLSLVATSACIVAALLLYIASPQQQLRAAGRWPTRHAWWPGTLLSLVALLLMWPLLAPLEAITAWLVLLMLVGSVLPFLGAWRARVRARSAA